MVLKLKNTTYINESPEVYDDRYDGLAEGIEIDFARTAVSCLQDAGADIQPENLEA